MKVVETIFDIVYLVLVFWMGIRMLHMAKGNCEYHLMGCMAVVLGAGDTFHLLPRIFAMWNGGLSIHTAALGFGKLVTSITMTIFYLMFYYWLKRRYHHHSERLDSVVWFLVTLRILLCFFPQNHWMQEDPSYLWGIFRNVPFVLLGIIAAGLAFLCVRRRGDHWFRHLWLAVLISFVCYVPVVLFAKVWPLMGMFMLPKTVAYLWMIAIFYCVVQKRC